MGRKRAGTDDGGRALHSDVDADAWTQVRMMQVVQRTSHYGAGDAVRRPEPDEPGEPHRLRW